MKTFASKSRPFSVARTFFIKSAWTALKDFRNPKAMRSAALFAGRRIMIKRPTLKE
jgi:hypothetical protein